MSFTPDYTYADLIDCYAKLGLSKGDDVFVSANLTSLMMYEDPRRSAVPKAHYNALRETVGPEGTIFVPTASLNLCNTDIPFDREKTPSYQMGMFAEYVRTRPDSYRSLHPFWSVAGIGPNAEPMLSDVSPHAYGISSIFDKFVKNDVTGINIGLSIRFAIPAIHHVETVMGVPYRYNKLFQHPVMINGKPQLRDYYLSVIYRNLEVIRDRNRKIAENFAADGGLRKFAVGRNFIHSFSHHAFFASTCNLMTKDMCCWLESPPDMGYVHN